MRSEMLLLLTWAVFAALALAGIAAGLVWAARNGQFGDQDRARYLALRSGIPPDEPAAREREP